MKPVLVIFHIYYTEQIPYFIEKMKNIHGVEWDLLVTGHNLTEEVKSRISSFRKDTVFLQTENRGYDIGPFIEAVKSVNLDRYGFVMKLHTKNIDKNLKFRHNGTNLSSHRWRDTMVDALLGSPEAFDAVLHAFDREDVGLVYSMSVIKRSRSINIDDSSLLKDELARLGLKPDSMDYCAGTIFAIKSEALRYLQGETVSADRFENTGSSHSSGTLAHSYERILCMAPSALGLKTVLVPKSDFLKSVYLIKRALQPVQPALEWLFSVNRFGKSQDKYLVLFGRRINLTRLQSGSPA